MTDDSSPGGMERDRKENPRTLADLVFVGFNSRVVALDRYSGEIVWDWKAPDGSGYVSVLIDGDRLVTGVNGYIYCLDPLNGKQLWGNELPGFGTGIPSLTSIHGTSGSAAAAAVIAHHQAQGAAVGAGA